MVETSEPMTNGQTKRSISACRGKVGMTPAVARQVAKRMKRTKGKSGASVTAYRCVCCGAWHVGSTDRRFV